MASGETAFAGTGEWKGPAPRLWWSSTVPSPQPCDGVQLAPASSLNDVRLHAAASCELKLRPVSWSTMVMASRVVAAVGAFTLVAVIFPAASHVIRTVLVPAPYIAAFRTGSNPIEGSPPLIPTE